MGAVTVGFKCQCSWRLPSGRQYMGIGWASWGGGGGNPPFERIPEQGVAHQCTGMAGACCAYLNICANGNTTYEHTDTELHSTEQSKRCAQSGVTDSERQPVCAA